MKTTILVFFFLSSILFAQHWNYYFQGNVVLSAEETEEYFYAGTTAGLIRIDKNSGDKTFYNVSNSDIPGNEIYAIAVQENVVWVGTKLHGIGKFDGSNWEVYNTENSGIPANSILSLALESDTLWIGTRNYGLARFDGAEWQTFTKYDTPMASNFVLNIAIADGTIWIGTAYGLVSKEQDNWQLYVKSNSILPDDRINDVCYENGILWVCCDGGVVKYDSTNWTLYNTQNSDLPLSNINSAAMQNNTLWLGASGGLIQFDGTNWSLYSVSNSNIHSSNITNVTAAGDSVFSASEKGASFFDGAGFHTLNLSNSGLPDDTFYDILINGQDTWFATRLGGLVKYDGTDWIVYDTTNSPFISMKINAIAMRTDELWISSGHQIYSFNGSDWSVYDSSNSALPYYTIRKLAVDENNKLWGSYAYGLVMYDGTNWHNYSESGRIGDANGITTIGDTVYLSIPAGKVIQFANGVFTTIMLLNGEPFPTPVYDVEKFNDTLWSVNYYGLQKYNGIDWESPDPSIYPVSTSEFQYLQSTDTDLWIISSDAIYRYDGAAFNSFSDEHGVILNEVLCFDVDDSSLWLGSFMRGAAQFSFSTSSADSTDLETPSEYILSQNYPNPFNPSTTIGFSMPETANVTLEIYDQLGQKVETLINQEYEAGYHELEWNASQHSSGVYLYVLKSGNYKSVKKMLLLK